MSLAGVEPAQKRAELVGQFLLDPELRKPLQVTPVLRGHRLSPQFSRYVSVSVHRASIRRHCAIS
jgi:hypothetical protein